MPSFGLPRGSWFLILGICLVLLPGKAHAFGAGNIPSIAQVEGHNWRHGDIEDMLEAIAFLHGKKWTSMLIKRTYFGNWLRDYSQAIDIGSLKGVNAATIRILVWVLSFMAHGYATAEFEVTEERLGVYRPEEHIDNPLGYADGLDARTFDPRLRGPVQPEETEIDPRTGMKNYISNERGGWSTSAGYLRYSFARSIHFGRLYTSGSSGKGKEEDLCEALRCLGQALHCMEDFSAHSNYCELALRELGHRNVFTHCGSQAKIHLHGKRTYPLVTGTFGAVDFLHSVLGEATDHFTQSEVDEVDIVLKNAEDKRSSGSSSSFFGIPTSTADFASLIGKVPGVGGDLSTQARSLKAQSDAQEQQNARNMTRDNSNFVPGMSPDFDPVKVSGQIYPILEFRDNVVKAISRGISKIPGLEKLIEKISETLTAFILGLLAPFIRPIIQQVSKVLKDGSSSVISASAQSQFEPWDNPKCTDPTHSMLSKDHFTNVLNSCAGQVAATILEYVTPRILYAWENTDVPVDEVVDDVLQAFHHPALRQESVEIHRSMFNAVRKWADEHPHRHELDDLLSSSSVRAGKNHLLKHEKGSGSRSMAGGGCGHAHGGHGKVSGSLWSQVSTRDLASMEGRDGDPANDYMSASPAPRPSHGSRPSYDYGSNPSHQNPPYSTGSPLGGYQQGGPPPGYGAPPPQPSYGGGGYGAPPPQPQYGGGYGAPPSGPPQGYGAPPPGQWGQPPPQSYGGPGYGAPPQQQQYGYQQPPPHHQHQQPPPGWGNYPGQRRY